MADQFESTYIRAQIRDVLLKVWDPIGIRDEPVAQDEYDSYLGEIYDLLVRRTSDSEIVEYLHWVAHKRMGFTAEASTAGALRTVGHLRAIPLPDRST